MQLRSTVFFLAALIATPALAQQPAGTIDCAGPFALDATEADLAAAFGSDNLAFGEVPGPEGSTFNATTVFPNDPERKLIIPWRDEAAKKGPSVIVEKPSNWTGPHGLKVGMPLAEVEKLNGAPFPILGFGWDYGGSAFFREGNLAPKPGGCSVSLTFELTQKAYDDPRFQDLMGDSEFSSSDMLMQEAQPTVSGFFVTWPAEEVIDGAEDEGDSSP